MNHAITITATACTRRNHRHQLTTTSGAELLDITNLETFPPTGGPGPTDLHRLATPVKAELRPLP